MAAQTWLPAPNVAGVGAGEQPSPHTARSPVPRGQQSRTRLGRSFHLSANEWLEPAKQQEGDSPSTVCRVREARECGARWPQPQGTLCPPHRKVEPAPRVPRVPRASFSWRSNGGQSSQRQRASVHSFLGNPKAGWPSLQEWEGGPEGEGFYPHGLVCQISGLMLERPPGLPPKTRGSGLRCTAPEMSPSVHPAKTSRRCWKDRTRQQEERGGGRCGHRKPCRVFLGAPECQVTGRTYQRAGVKLLCVILTPHSQEFGVNSQAMPVNLGPLPQLSELSRRSLMLTTKVCPFPPNTAATTFSRSQTQAR